MVGGDGGTGEVFLVAMVSCDNEGVWSVNRLEAGCEWVWFGGPLMVATATAVGLCKTSN